MKHFWIVLIFIAIGCSTTSVSNRSPEFVLFPGLHKLFLDSTWSFSLSDLLESIQSNRVDAVCVEIPENEFDRDSEGLYPPEAAAIAASFDGSIAIVPADWRASHDLYKKPSASTEAKLKQLQRTFDTRLNSRPTGRLAFALSNEGESAIEQIHQTVIESDGEAADGFWLQRNQRIAKNCVEKAIQNGSRRIGLVFGIDHLYILKTYLKQMGFKVQDANLMLAASQNISPAIIARWQRNLTNLQGLAAANNSQADVIKQSGRIEDLEAFVSKTSTKQ